MCNTNGCYNGACCEPEEMTIEDQKAFLEEREKILEAKLATVRHLKETLGKKETDDK